MIKTTILTGENYRNVTRFMDETGAIYVAQPDTANTCKGCAFKFCSLECCEVPSYCSSRRHDGQSVIWIKESP